MRLAEQLEATIRSNRLLDLPVSWADEVIYPHYGGLSLLNIARSILSFLGVETNLTLDPMVWNGPPPDVDRVVLIISDGLGYRLLNEMIADDAEVARFVETLTGGRGALPLTSVAPSTTCVALPTFWTAQPAIASGMLGTIMYLREASALSDILRFRPAGKAHPNGMLEAMGISAEDFVLLPSVGEELATLDTPIHLLLDYALYNTGLSKIMHRGVTNIHAHTGQSDFYLRLEDLLRQTAGDRCYVSAYLPNVDGLSHFYGADNRYVRYEIKQQLRRLCDVLGRGSVRDGRTLVMIVADHGHADAPNVFDVKKDRSLSFIAANLRAEFGAESRLPYLYLWDQSARERIIQRLRDDYTDCVAWIEREAAVDAGLFGPGTPHIEAYQRLGDLILIPRGGTRFADNVHSPKPISVHGGLSDREMLVPFMWQVI